MTELLLSKYFLIVVFLIIQLELIYQHCLVYYIFNVRDLYTDFSNKVFNFINTSVYNIFFLFSIWTERGLFNTLFISIIMLYFVIYILNLVLLNYIKCTKYNLSILTLINTSLYIYTYLFFFVNSLLSLLFVLELLTVLYYFYFLNNYSNTKLSLLQYKNSLLLFLWNSFLTTAFFNLLLVFSFKNYGTIAFYELNLCKLNIVFIILLLVSISWKLGLPIFHFFKIELYKYLLKESIFLFSIMTIIINIFIFIFIFLQYFVYTTFLVYQTFILIFIVLFIVVLVNVNIANFFYFLAYSSLITMSTAVSLLLS